MPTIADQLNELVNQKKALVSNLNTKGVSATEDEKLNTLNHIQELMESNITSFKIEGRMKSKEYVYMVSSVFATRTSEKIFCYFIFGNKANRRNIRKLL